MIFDDYRSGTVYFLSIINITLNHPLLLNKSRIKDDRNNCYGLEIGDLNDRLWRFKRTPWRFKMFFYNGRIAGG